MSKSPHTLDFRAKVSQEYLDGLGSYNYLSAQYNIGTRTLRGWVLSSVLPVYGIFHSTQILF